MFNFRFVNAKELFLLEVLSDAVMSGSGTTKRNQLLELVMHLY